MDGEDLMTVFLAALEVVVPEVTSEQRALVRDVVDGMMRERKELLALPPGGVTPSEA
jgi:hypothetical protein